MPLSEVKAAGRLVAGNPDPEGLLPLNAAPKPVAKPAVAPRPKPPVSAPAPTVPAPAPVVAAVPAPAPGPAPGMQDPLMALEVIGAGPVPEQAAQAAAVAAITGGLQRAESATTQAEQKASDIFQEIVDAFGHGESQAGIDALFEEFDAALNDWAPLAQDELRQVNAIGSPGASFFDETVDSRWEDMRARFEAALPAVQGRNGKEVPLTLDQAMDMDQVAAMVYAPISTETSATSLYIVRQQTASQAQPAALALAQQQADQARADLDALADLHAIAGPGAAGHGDVEREVEQRLRGVEALASAQLEQNARDLLDLWRSNEHTARAVDVHNRDMQLAMMEGSGFAANDIEVDAAAWKQVNEAASASHQAFAQATQNVTLFSGMLDVSAAEAAVEKARADVGTAMQGYRQRGASAHGAAWILPSDAQAGEVVVMPGTGERMRRLPDLSGETPGSEFIDGAFYVPLSPEASAVWDRQDAVAAAERKLRDARGVLAEHEQAHFAANYQIDAAGNVIGTVGALEPERYSVEERVGVSTALNAALAKLDKAQAALDASGSTDIHSEPVLNLAGAQEEVDYWRTRNDAITGLDSIHATGAVLPSGDRFVRPGGHHSPGSTVRISGLAAALGGPVEVSRAEAADRVAKASALPSQAPVGLDDLRDTAESAQARLAASEAALQAALAERRTNPQADAGRIAALGRQVLDDRYAALQAQTAVQDKLAQLGVIAAGELAPPTPFSMAGVRPKDVETLAAFTGVSAGKADKPLPTRSDDLGLRDASYNFDPATMAVSGSMNHDPVGKVKLSNGVEVSRGSDGSFIYENGSQWKVVEDETGRLTLYRGTLQNVDSKDALGQTQSHDEFRWVQTEMDPATRMNWDALLGRRDATIQSHGAAAFADENSALLTQKPPPAPRRDALAVAVTDPEELRAMQTQIGNALAEVTGGAPSAEMVAQASAMAQGQVLLIDHGLNRGTVLNTMPNHESLAADFKPQLMDAYFDAASLGSGYNMETLRMMETAVDAAGAYQLARQEYWNFMPWASSLGADGSATASNDVKDKVTQAMGALADRQLETIERFGASPEQRAAAAQQRAVIAPELAADEQQTFVNDRLTREQRFDHDATLKLMNANMEVFAKDNLLTGYHQFGNGGAPIDVGTPADTARWVAQALGHADDRVVRQIRSAAGDKGTMTILGGMYTTEKGENDTVLFQVDDGQGNTTFIDEAGRVYAAGPTVRDAGTGHFGRFAAENLLPSTHSMLALPANGSYAFDGNGELRLAVGDARTETGLQTARRVGHLDEVASVTLMTAGIASMFATGGATSFLLGAAMDASMAYMAATSTDKLMDKAAHQDDINPFSSWENFGLYLDLGSSVLGAAGVAKGLGVQANMMRSELSVARLEGELKVLQGAGATTLESQLAIAAKTRELESATRLLAMKPSLLVDDIRTARRLGLVSEVFDAPSTLLGVADLANNWDYMTPGQRQYALAMTLGDVGMATVPNVIHGLTSRPGEAGPTASTPAPAQGAASTQTRPTTPSADELRTMLADPDFLNEMEGVVRDHQDGGADAGAGIPIAPPRPRGPLPGVAPMPVSGPVVLLDRTPEVSVLAPEPAGDHTSLQQPGEVMAPSAALGAASEPARNEPAALQAGETVADDPVPTLATDGAGSGTAPPQVPGSPMADPGDEFLPIQQVLDELADLNHGFSAAEMEGWAPAILQELQTLLERLRNDDFDPAYEPDSDLALLDALLSGPGFEALDAASDRTPVPHGLRAEDEAFLPFTFAQFWEINAQESADNCFSCALALAATSTGAPSVPLPGRPFVEEADPRAPAYMRDETLSRQQKKHELIREVWGPGVSAYTGEDGAGITREEMQARLENAGPGLVAMIEESLGVDGASHWLNAVTGTNGQLYYVDGMFGDAVSSLGAGDTARYKVFIVRDGSAAAPAQRASAAEVNGRLAESIRVAESERAELQKRLDLAERLDSPAEDLRRKIEAKDDLLAALSDRRVDDPDASRAPSADAPATAARGMPPLDFPQFLQGAGVESAKALVAASPTLTARMAEFAAEGWTLRTTSDGSHVNADAKILFVNGRAMASDPVAAIAELAHELGHRSKPLDTSTREAYVRSAVTEEAEALFFGLQVRAEILEATGRDIGLPGQGAEGYQAIHDAFTTGAMTREAAVAAIADQYAATEVDPYVAGAMAAASASGASVDGVAAPLHADVVGVYYDLLSELGQLDSGAGLAPTAPWSGLRAGRDTRKNGAVSQALAEGYGLDQVVGELNASPDRRLVVAARSEDGVHRFFVVQSNDSQGAGRSYEISTGMHYTTDELLTRELVGARIAVGRAEELQPGVDPNSIFAQSRLLLDLRMRHRLSADAAAGRLDQLAEGSVAVLNDSQGHVYTAVRGSGDTVRYSKDGRHVSALDAAETYQTGVLGALPGTRPPSGLLQNLGMHVASAGLVAAVVIAADMARNSGHSAGWFTVESWPNVPSSMLIARAGVIVFRALKSKKFQSQVQNLIASATPEERHAATQALRKLFVGSRAGFSRKDVATATTGLNDYDNIAPRLDAAGTAVKHLINSADVAPFGATPAEQHAARQALQEALDDQVRVLDGNFDEIRAIFGDPARIRFYEHDAKGERVTGGAEIAPDVALGRLDTYIDFDVQLDAIIRQFKTIGGRALNPDGIAGKVTDAGFIATLAVSIQSAIETALNPKKAVWERYVSAPLTALGNSMFADRLVNGLNSRGLWLSESTLTRLRQAEWQFYVYAASAAVSAVDNGVRAFHDDTIPNVVKVVADAIFAATALKVALNNTGLRKSAMNPKQEKPADADVTQALRNFGLAVGLRGVAGFVANHEYNLGWLENPHVSFGAKSAGPGSGTSVPGGTTSTTTTAPTPTTSFPGTTGTPGVPPTP